MFACPFVAHLAKLPVFIVAQWFEHKNTPQHLRTTLREGAKTLRVGENTETTTHFEEQLHADAVIAKIKTMAIMLPLHVPHFELQLKAADI